MSEKPISVIAVSIILVALGIVTTMDTFKYLQSFNPIMMAKFMPIKMVAGLTLDLVGPIVMLICGVAILVAQNWARFLFVIWYGADFLLLLLNGALAERRLIALAIYLIIAFLLFRPKANQFFGKKHSMAM